MGLLLQRLVLEQQLSCECQHYFCSIRQYKSKKKNQKTKICNNVVFLNVMFDVQCVKTALTYVNLVIC